MSRIDEIKDEFKSWNPMRDDYLDSGFNLYDSGPGAALDSELQPAELAKLKEEKEKRAIVYPYLVFKNLPKNMTEKGITQLCQRHGIVKEVNYVAKLHSVFVKFNNIADMESVYRALSDNEYGFKVLIGKNFSNQRNTKKPFDVVLENVPRRPVIDSSPSSSGIDLEKRTIRPSGKKPPRPKFSDENKIEIGAENSAILRSDPLCSAIKDGDSHSLERSGISMLKISSKIDDEFEYRTGRAHLNMPEKIRKCFEEKHANSNVEYNAEKGIYSNKPKNKDNFKVTYSLCIVCKQPTDFICYRCGSEIYSYCGQKCQNADWENHRKICGQKIKNVKTSSPMTPSPQNQNKREQILKVEKSPSLSSESSHDDPVTGKTFPKPEMPSTNSLVAMLTVSKTNLVFIRSKSPEDNIKYFETISKIHAARKNFSQLKKLPTVGQPVISQFKNSSQYGRALVLNVKDEENIQINFLDYGNIEIQKLSNLFNIPKNFIGLPRFAVPVVLKDVPNYYMTNEIRSFMYSYLRDIDLVIKYDSEEDLMPSTRVYQVDLYDASTNQHLNKTIVALCKPREPANVDEIITIQDLEVRPLPVGENIRLYVMDNSQLNVGCISCTTKEFALEIEKFSQDIQRYANSLKEQTYAPGPDELCIAKYSVDGQWYRGRCLEKVGDGKPTILFIDYGNIAYVKVADIRPYPPKFTWPIFTGDYGIEGLPEDLNEKLIQRLEELIPFGCPIDWDFVENVEGNFYNLRKPDLIKRLKKENLLN